MREVNFSIPTANKASVGITTALYDRRALDCTSTLPLINSLNHLAYLTTSSSRIRDILTVDGGVERLVCILKEGRGKDVMDIWKWSLAFQCIVNIGVRGSEAVRTRVVEADVVPVISTILDNYIRVVDMCRERAEVDISNGASQKTRSGDSHRSANPGAGAGGPESSSSSGNRVASGSRHHHHHSSSSGASTSGAAASSQRTRRNAPPNINIPRMPSDQRTVVAPATDSSDSVHVSPQSQHRHPSRQVSSTNAPSSSPVSSATHTPSRPHQSLMNQVDHPPHSSALSEPGSALPTPEPLGSMMLSSALPSAASPHRNVPAASGPPTGALSSQGDRTPRESDRFVLIPPHIQTQMTSQPNSPTTPGNLGNSNLLDSTPTAPEAIVSELANAVVPEAHSGSVLHRERNSVVGMDADIRMEDINRTRTLEDAPDAVHLVAAPVNSEVTEPFSLDHPNEVDERGLPSVGEGTTQIALSPTTRVSNSPADINAQTAHPTFAWQPRSLVDRNLAASLLSVMPRDDDVLMSLQLLAYVSKYCNLRTYFQNTHLVPRLKIPQHLLDAEFGRSPSGADAKRNIPDQAALEDEWDSEYLLPDDVNIFPLVEKFTIRHNSQEMQYWAGVVMRNLCRKDDSRGGIRQCAYYKCGKWEEYTRQFAKCRRCRRTKYCSKECQKNAWAYHRHWCVQAQAPQS